jgi:hypothetical protein
MYNECRHIFTSGKKCQSPALKDQSFCYFHSNTRKRPAPKDEAYEPYIAPQDTAHNLPPLEDADAIQLALSDVVLALAANRIDPRRARILIYGLQVASQNHHRRVPGACPERSRRVRGAEGAANVGFQAAAAIVRETHEHEDGTLIGPSKQVPDPEEIREKRRPSLGEILLREAEAMKAEREAERQADRQAEAQQKAVAEAEDHPVSITIPQIQAVAHVGAPQPALSLSKGLAEMWECPQSAPSPNITNDSTLSRLHLLQPKLPNIRRKTNLAKVSGGGGNQGSVNKVFTSYNSPEME